MSPTVVMPDQAQAWLLLHALNHGFGEFGCNPDECAPCAALEWCAVNAPTEVSDLIVRYAGHGWAFQTRVGTVDWNRLRVAWSRARADEMAKEEDDAADLPG